MNTVAEQIDKLNTIFPAYTKVWEDMKSRCSGLNYITPAIMAGALLDNHPISDREHFGGTCISFMRMMNSTDLFSYSYLCNGELYDEFEDAMVQPLDHEIICVMVPK